MYFRRVLNEGETMPSKRDIPIEAIRLKLFRIEQGLTQKEMASILGTKQNIADIERGRIRISGSILEALIRCFNLNASWLFGHSDKKYLIFTKEAKPPLVITTDSEGNENISMVSGKAYAGYSNNLHNPEWFRALPSFSLPIASFQNQSLRCFQIVGDSMKGIIEDGEYALCSYVEGPRDWSKEKVYIIVTEDSILCKRLAFDLTNDVVSLISINTEYPIQHMDTKEVLEIWEVKGKISPDIKRYLPEMRSQDMFIELQSIRQDIRQINTKIDNIQ